MKNEPNNENIELKKKLIKEEEIKLPDPNQEKKANKIINFLSSLLILIIIIFGIYFLMNKGILPNPFEIKNENPIIPMDQISTTTITTKKRNENSVYYKAKSTTCSLGTTEIEINNQENTFNFVIFDNVCTKQALTGSFTYDIAQNSYTFTTETNETFLGKFNNRTLVINHGGTTYELVNENE